MGHLLLIDRDRALTHDLDKLFVRRQTDLPPPKRALDVLKPLETV